MSGEERSRRKRRKEYAEITGLVDGPGNLTKEALNTMK